MNLSVLLHLLARRSVAITLGALIGMLAGLLVLERLVLTPKYTEIRALQVVLGVVYTVLTTGALISFGGFLGRVTGELESVRLSRIVPGLRRSLNTSILLLVPLVPAVAALFLSSVLTSGQNAVHPIALWSVATFLFALGLGLGWSWLLFVVMAGLLWKLPWLLTHLRASPIPTSITALSGAGALLALRHHRFLAPLGRVPWAPKLNWLRSTFSFGTKTRRAEEFNRPVPDWPTGRDDDILIKLIRAGVYERHGYRRGMLAGRVLFWVALIHFAFLVVVYWAATAHRDPRFGQFAFALVTTDAPVPMNILMVRGVFGALTGWVAYICAVVLDCTLLPNFWHPISRSTQARAVFWSHVRQNVSFAVLHLAISLVVVFGLARSAPAAISRSALAAFILPTFFVFILMPIPQALFPNGTELFKNRTNPAAQLFAGLVGGLFCLLVIYWCAYWPLKGLHDRIPLVFRAILLLGTALATYGIYYLSVRRRFKRSDLRPRWA